MEIKEHFRHWLPRLLKADGVTIGNNIYYKSFSVPTTLRRHEEVHVEQYKRYGIPLFLALYLTYYLIGRLQGKDHWQAYKDIPFEVEARKAEKY